MADKEAVNAARQGADAFDRWNRSALVPRIDLSGADLNEVDLRWTNLAGADLEGTNFSGALLTGAYFGPSTFRREADDVTQEDVPVNLEHTDFSDALLLAATFNYPQIEHACFERAYLALANFRRTDFSSNSFRGAQLYNTSFMACTLAGAQHLDETKHFGPSHLDIETFSRSGTLPKSFLQQVGISDIAIDYIPDITSPGDPIGFFSCFLSHATRDREFCDQLYSSLVKAGIRVWYAPEDMRGGEQLVPQITKAINLHDRVVIVLSEHSMQSQWVCNEIRWASSRREKTGAQSLFPISLVPFSDIRDWELVDPDTGLDIAAHVRSYFIPDFSNWRDSDSFSTALDRLVRDLNADPSLAPGAEQGGAGQPATRSESE